MSDYPPAFSDEIYLLSAVVCHSQASVATQQQQQQKRHQTRLVGRPSLATRPAGNDGRL